MLNKKFNDRKPGIWFTNHNFIIEVDEGNHENYDSNDEEKKQKTCNPNDPNFDLFKFLGEINLHISTLREENEENKGNNKATNKVDGYFKKIIAVTKLKELK